MSGSDGVGEDETAVADIASGSHGRLLDELIEHEEAWHYHNGRRDLRLDLMRGFAALAMIVDHIGGSSWLYPVTGGNRFVVSAAEAFVFISGAVMGIVYLNVFVKQGLGATLMKAFHRAWTLYVVTVLLTLCFAATSYLLDLPWTPDVSEGGLAGYVLDVATLHRTIYLVDVILIYVLLLLAAGPVIVLLSQGHALVALAVSWALWAVWQLAPESARIPWDIRGNEVFFFPSWQVLFVTGIVIGWHREAIERWVRSLPAGFVASLVAGTVVVSAGLLVLQLTILDNLTDNTTLYSLAFDKPDVPVGRLAVFVVLAIASFSLATELWQPIRRATGWLLLPLGQNALTAYSFHLFVVAATTKLTYVVLEDLGSRKLVDTGLQIAGLLCVWLFVKYEPVVVHPLRDKAAAWLNRASNRFDVGANATV